MILRLIIIKLLKHVLKGKSLGSPEKKRHNPYIGIKTGITTVFLLETKQVRR